MVSMVMEEGVLEVTDETFRGGSMFAFGSWNETLFTVAVGCEPRGMFEVVEVFDRRALCCDITA